jgi:hypothetical protein
MATGSICAPSDVWQNGQFSEIHFQLLPAEIPLIASISRRDINFSHLGHFVIDGLFRENFNVGPKIYHD